MKKYPLWLLVVLILALAMAAVVSAMDATEVEPNDSFAKAMPIEVGQTIKGTVHYGDYDHGDIYRVTLPANTQAHVQVWGFPSDCRFRICAYGFRPNSSTDLIGDARGNDGRPVTLSFDVGESNRGYINVSILGPIHSSFSGANWNANQYSADGRYHLAAPYNQIPEGLPQAHNNIPVEGPVTYNVRITTGPRPSLPSGLTDSSGEAAPRPSVESGGLTLARTESWSRNFSRRRYLEIEARLDYNIPAGGAYAMEILLNGQPLSRPLDNKGSDFRYADGRGFDYFKSDAGAGAWLVFYSPDFLSNNGAAGGGYQVLTDPGQAYVYRWDLAKISTAAGDDSIRLDIRNICPINQSLIFKVGLSDK